MSASSSSDATRHSSHGAPQRLEQRGATMVEYGLLLTLIAIVAVAAISLVGQNVSEMFSEAGSAFD